MPVALPEEQVAEWRRCLPEMPGARRRRVMAEYGLPEYDARVLTGDRAVIDYFEEAAELSDNPKAISNWVMTEVLRFLSRTGMSAGELPATPQALAALVKLVDDKTVNVTTAKDIFAILCDRGGDPEEIVKAQGLGQVSESGAIEELVGRAMADNPKSVADYRSGKKAAAKFLVGQVMRLSNGKANPQVVGRLLEKKLARQREADL